MGQNQIRQAQQHLLALARRTRRPSAGFEHLPRVAHRCVDVLLTASRHVGQALAGGGVDGRECLSRLRRTGITVDHGLVGKPQRSGLVLPICKLEHVQMLQGLFLCMDGGPGPCRGKIVKMSSQTMKKLGSQSPWFRRLWLLFKREKNFA